MSNERVDDDSAPSGIFDRWGRAISDRWRWIVAAGLVLGAVVFGTWTLASDGNQGEDILFEPAASIGPNPFTTEGVVAGAPPTDSSTTALYGGSGDIGVCDPARLVAFLESHPDKAAAWVDALNADPTLTWSGGNHLRTSDIAAYVAELTPTFLTRDTRVTNNGYKNGKATPRQAVLEEGTAVLVDANGDPRVRCKCGNPLDAPDDDDTSTTTTENTTTTTETTTTTTENTTTTTEPDDPDNPPDTPHQCAGVPPLPPLSDLATDITTAPVDFDGDGSPDLLTVYQLGSSWHVRAEIAGAAVDDEIVFGAGAMTAIGGATVDNDPFEEAWVKVSALGASTDTIGVYVFRECDLQRVLLNDAPAEFPIGASTTYADGLQCFGFDTGIEVFTTTSTDGITYTGNSMLYTIDLSGPAPILVLGATASQSESNPPGGPAFQALTMFNCDTLSNIP